MVLNNYLQNPFMYMGFLEKQLLMIATFNTEHTIKEHISG